MKDLKRYIQETIRKSLSEYLSEYGIEHRIPKIDVVHLFLNHPLDSKDVTNAGFIIEAKTCFTPIPNTKFSYRFDKPRGEPGPGNLKHAHIYSKGKEIFAMNVDGTAHDGFHHVEIPSEVGDFLRNKGFHVPDDNIIEVLYEYTYSELLLD